VGRLESGDDLIPTDEREARREVEDDAELTNKDFFWDL
jgi:hypothetical protein